MVYSSRSLSALEEIRNEVVEEQVDLEQQTLFTWIKSKVVQDKRRSEETVLPIMVILITPPPPTLLDVVRGKCLVVSMNHFC